MILPIVLAVAAVIIVITIAAVIGVILKNNADREKRAREDALLKEEREAAELEAERIKKKEEERTHTPEEPLMDENGNLQASVDKWMWIKGADQGYCLEAQEMIGGHIIPKECANTDGQKWLIDPVTKRIKSKTGYCMSTGGDYHSLQECDISNDMQKMVYDSNANRIKSVVTGECIANRKNDWVWDWGCDKNNDDQYTRFSTSF